MLGGPDRRQDQTHPVTYPCSPVIIVQLIRTRWTKQSRGAPGASKRKASPTVLAAPTTPTNEEVLVHDVLFDEGTDFEQLSQCLAVSFERAKDSGDRPTALRCAKPRGFHAGCRADPAMGAGSNIERFRSLGS